jgi:hypothetical protein
VAAINPAGVMVGFYLEYPGTGGELYHGFLVTNGAFTRFDFPGAISTLPFGINASGEIMGSYIDTDGTWHGFLIRDAAFTTIDPPDSVMTFASGINSSGDIVGYYYDDSWVAHGFLLKRGEK